MNSSTSSPISRRKSPAHGIFLLFFLIVGLSAGQSIFAHTLPISPPDDALLDAQPPCTGDLVKLTLVYNGPAGASVQVFRRANGSQLLASFASVQPGDVLTIDSRGASFGNLLSTTWFDIQDPNNPCTNANGCLAAVPTGCSSYTAQRTFGDLTVSAYMDQGGQTVTLGLINNRNRQVSAPVSNQGNTQAPSGNVTNRTIGLNPGLVSGSPRRNNGQGQAKSGADLDGNGLSYNSVTEEIDVNPGDGIELNSDLVEVKATDLDGSGIVVTNNNIDVNPGDGIVISGDQVEANVSDFEGAGISANGNDLDVNVDGTTIEIDPNDDLRIASGAAGNGLDGGSNVPLRVGDGAGIGVTANEIQVNVDNSTIDIEPFTDALRVSAGGITNNEMAVDAIGTGNIIDGTVNTRDIASGGNTKVLTTDATGQVTWADQSAILPAQTDGDGLVADIFNNETDVNPGDGIAVNNDQVEVVASDLEGDGLSVNNNNLDVNTGDGLTITSDNLEVVASDIDGTGLTTTGNDLSVNPGPGIALFGDQVVVNTNDLAGDGIGVNGTTFQLEVNTDNSTIETDGADNIRVKAEGITANEIGTGAVTTDEILDGTITTQDIGQNGATNGEALIWNGTAWVPGTTNDPDSDPTNEFQDLSSSTSGTNRTINITNGTGTTINIADNDNDVTNELQTITQAGNNVTLSNGGGTISVADNDNDSSNEIQSLGSTASGTSRTINISGGGTGTFFDIADNDNDPANEFNTGATLTGNTLNITDAGGTQSVDLGVLNNTGTDDQNLTGATLTGSNLTIDIENGTSTTANLSALEESADIAQVASDLQTHITNDGDVDASNELQTLSQSGNTVTLSNGGGSISVADNDNDSSNEIQNLSNSSSGTNRTINITSGTGTTINVADNDNDPANEFNTGATLTGNTLNITDAGGTQSVDLSVLNNTGSDDQNLTGATLTGSNLTIDIENGTSTTANLSALEESADIAQVATDLQTHITADGDLDATNEIQNLSNSSSGTNRTINITGGSGTTINVADNDNDSANEIQNLSLSGSQLSISSGNTITLPPDGDSDSSNELQTISKSGSTVTLSNGGGSFTDAVNDADASTTNELQNLSLSGNTLSISSGNNVSLAGFVNTDNQDLSSSTSGTNRTINITGGSGTTINVADNDNNSSNELQTISKSGSTVTLSNGGGSFTDAVNDADASATNELQSLSISGSTISLTNGGGSVTVPSTADNLGNHSATTTLQLNNFNISEVNNLSINDAGAGEGISWAGTAANWGIDVSPATRTNADGDLNLFGTANNIIAWRPLYERISGTNYRVWNQGNDGSGSGLDADLLDGQNSSVYLDNTDNQNLSSSTSGTNRTINITGGSNTTISVADNDNNSSNELQTLGISGSTLTLSNGGGSVAIPAGADNLGNHLATTNLNMNGNDIDFVRGSTGQIRSVGQISFDWTNGTYDTPTNHGIRSADETGTLTDDISINSFDGIFNRLDANNNNGTSYFKVEHHSTGNGTDLFWVRSADGYGYLRGRFGIGTTAPSQALDVNGNVRIRGGAPAVGHVLTATSTNGTGDWAAPADGSSTNELQNLSISGSTISLSNGGGSVTVPSTADNLGNHTATTTLNMNNQNISNVNNLSVRAADSYDKLRVWNSSSYTIGMNSAMTLGFLNDYATTFTMNNDADRGWVWRDVSDAKSDGAMSLTTGGRLYVKGSSTFASDLGVGTTSPGADLHVFRADNDIARVYATGSSQGSGMFYAGQSTAFGGGFVYDGDGTPSLVGGTDRISFFRRNNNADTEVMSYGYSNSTVRISSLAGSGNRMVIANANGDMFTQAIPTGDITGVTAGTGLTGGGTSGTVTVNAVGTNGLTTNANDIRLGGTLIQATTITQANQTMTFNMTGTGDFNINDNGTTHFQVRDDGLTFIGDDMYWRDGSTSGTNLMILTDDGNDGRLRIYENGATSVDLDANSQFVFNEQGLDRNFRIESDADVFNFWADAGLNRIGIGESAPKTKLHIEDAAGQTLMLARNDGSITSGEQLGGIGFDGSDGNVPDDIREASASIIAFASETHGTGDKGGRLTFWTSPLNQNDDTDGFERLRIDQDGNHYVGGDMYWRDQSVTATNIARIVDDGNDGQLIIYENGGTAHIIDGNSATVFNENSTNKDFRVESDGNTHQFFLDASTQEIGIRTSAPAATLHIKSHSNNASIGGLRIEDLSTASHNWHFGISSDSYLRFTENGSTNSGVAFTGSGVTVHSDKRAKDGIETMDDVLERVMELRPVTYIHKDDENKKRTMGFIAQEVNELFPEPVFYHKDIDRYALKYSDFGVLSVKAIQEMNGKFTDREEEVDNELKKLRKDVEKIKKHEGIATAPEESLPVGEGQPAMDQSMLAEMQRTLAMQQELIAQQQEMITDMRGEVDGLREMLESSQATQDRSIDKLIDRIYLSEQAIIELGSCCDEKGGENSLETGDNETLLFQNHPNPFNRVTTITYKLAQAGHTELVIYDDSSMPIETVVNEDQDVGIYNIEWDGSNYTSGVYIYMLKQNDVVLAKKMVLIK